MGEVERLEAPILEVALIERRPGRGLRVVGSSRHPDLVRIARVLVAHAARARHEHERRFWGDPRVRQVAREVEYDLLLEDVDAVDPGSAESLELLQVERDLARLEGEARGVRPHPERKDQRP